MIFNLCLAIAAALTVYGYWRCANSEDGR